jgi:hypothetical protein
MARLVAQGNQIVMAKKRCNRNEVNEEYIYFLAEWRYGLPYIRRLSAILHGKTSERYV